MITHPLPRVRRTVVLVVEEQPRTREAVRRALETLGVTVLTADSSGDALRIVREFIPSAIMADLSIADGHGRALAVELGKLPYARSVPILAFSRAARSIDPAQLFNLISTVVVPENRTLY